MERSNEQLQALLEQSANYGRQLLEEKIALERETEEMREKYLEKEEELTQQVFELRRKLEVSNNLVTSLQVWWERLGMRGSLAVGHGFWSGAVFNRVCSPISFF